MSRIIKFSPVSHRIDNRPVEIGRLSPFCPAEEPHEDGLAGETALSTANQKAQAILKDAERRAAQIVDGAKEEAAAKERELIEKEANIDQHIKDARNKASAKGYEEGYQHGRSDAERDYMTKLDEATKILSMVQADYQQKIQQSEPEIIQLSVEIAGKIVSERLQFDESWMHFISETLKQVKGEEDIRIFVSPKFYEVTSSFTKEVSTQLNSEILVYPDDTLKDHSCLIETKYGQIDASVDSQMNELRKKLLELVGDENGHQADVESTP